MSDWLYQVRIRVSERLSESLRSGSHTDLANDLDKISNDHGMSLVCTYDAFKGYCDEAEEHGIEEYALYDWTKATIENPEKKAKLIKTNPILNAKAMNKNITIDKYSDKKSKNMSKF